MNDLCPHCICDMNLSTEFMVNHDMFAPDHTGEFDCPVCGEKVRWRSREVIEHEYEKVEEET